VRTRGFTLLEVLVAAVLLGVGLAAAAGTFRVAATSLARAARLERALLATEAVVDSLAHEGAVGSGERGEGGFRIGWTEAGGGGGILIHAVAGTGRRDTLLALWFEPSEGGGGGEGR